MHAIVGNNIRHRREELAWTQEHLAAAADVSPRTVQRAEAGHPLSPENLKSIAAALSTTVEVLRMDRAAAANDAKMRAAKARYSIVPMEKAERGSDLLRCVFRPS